jgi:hypothetical protein
MRYSDFHPHPFPLQEGEGNLTAVSMDKKKDCRNFQLQTVLYHLQLGLPGIKIYNTYHPLPEGEGNPISNLYETKILTRLFKIELVLYFG